MPLEKGEKPFSAPSQGARMRPKSERSSVRERFARWLIPFGMALPACGSAQAEVGSGLPPDAGLSGPCGSVGLRLYYWAAHPGDTTNQIDFAVKIENATGAPVPSESLKV